MSKKPNNFLYKEMQLLLVVLQIRSGSYKGVRNPQYFLRTIVSHEILRRSFLKLLFSRYSQIFANLSHCQQRLSKVSSIDLISKQEALDVDPKAIQYYFTRNLDHAGNARMLFIVGEIKYIRQYCQSFQSLTGVTKSYILDQLHFTNNN